MLKSSFALLLAVVIIGVNGASISVPTLPPSQSAYIKHLSECANAASAAEKKCTADLPPSLKNIKNFDFLRSHPEMCCPAYEALLCMEQQMNQVNACQQVGKDYVQSLFDDLMKGFPANGCNVQTCKQ